MANVNAPQALSYGPPNVQFEGLDQLGQKYFQGAEERRKYELARAFHGGIPKDANGNPDFKAMAEVLAQKGAPEQVVPLSREALDREQLAAAQGGAPLGNAVAPPGGPPAASPAPRMVGVPPRPVSAPTPPPAPPGAIPQPALSSAGTDNAGAQTMRALATELAGGKDVSSVIKNVAMGFKVDPDAALTPEQEAQLKPILAKSIASMQPPPQAQGAPAAQPQSGGGNVALANTIAQANGFPDYRTALSEIHKERRPLSGNPYAKDRVAELTALATQISGALINPDAQGNIDRAFFEQKRQHDLLAGKPVPIAPGTQLVDPLTGKPIFHNEGGLADSTTLDAMAAQAEAGDTSVFTNLGRGAQGAENVIALRKRIAERNRERGEGGSEQAMRNAEFFGVKAGQRTVGARSANIELAATEFKQILPIVMEASKAVNRTNYPDLNKIIQAFEEKTGDPNIVKFGGGVNTLVNLYARAISPTGQTTVSDKDHARLILNRAWSQGQFEAAAGMMSQEIDAALASPDKVRDAMRKRFLEGQGGAKAPAVATPAPAAEAPAIPLPPPGFQLVK